MSTAPQLLEALTSPRRDGIECRFWAKVSESGPDKCWEWTGSRNGVGYGQLWVSGRPCGAHQVSFIIAFGWLPPTVMHKCDNRPCVNPRHLFGGTHAENVADAVAKGRMGKVTPAIQSTILALREEGMSYRAIGRQVGVSNQTVLRVVTGRYRYRGQLAGAV